MAATPKQKTITVGGIDFTLQHPGVRKVFQMSDSSKDQYGNIKSEPYYAQLMEHVIVNPKITWEYWDENEEIADEVMREAVRFLGVGK